MIVEVCSNSFQSALNAALAGADRVELCSELAVGGLSPSYGTIKKVCREIEIDVNVLIRPRSGDFTYSESEFEIMKEDIRLCKELGCHGIVSGILTNTNEIDLHRTKVLSDLARPLKFTFHRAFDWLNQPLNAIQQLIDLKVDHILSSGQKNTAVEGIELLKEMQQMAGKKLTIMPGGGVNSSNITAFKEAGFRDIHFSATTLKKSDSKVKIPMNSKRFFDEAMLAQADPAKIKKMVNLVK